MSRRHFIFVALLFFALCTRTDELILSLLGMAPERPAWCPAVVQAPWDYERARQSEVSSTATEPAEVCPLQASVVSIDPASLSCPVDPAGE